MTGGARVRHAGAGLSLLCQDGRRAGQPCHICLGSEVARNGSHSPISDQMQVLPDALLVSHCSHASACIQNCSYSELSQGFTDHCRCPPDPPSPTPAAPLRDSAFRRCSSWSLAGAGRLFSGQEPVGLLSQGQSRPEWPAAPAVPQPNGGSGGGASSHWRPEPTQEFTRQLPPGEVHQVLPPPSPSGE